MTDRITSLKSTYQKLLRRYPIAAIYLFGSQARGDVGPLSDYDFAVLFDGHAAESRFFDLKLKIMGELSSCFKTDRVDLVVLNQAPSNLAMKVIAEGVVIGCRDDRQRIDFEVKTMRVYLDREYYEERYNTTMHQQILAGQL